MQAPSAGFPAGCPFSHQFVLIHQPNWAIGNKPVTDNGMRHAGFCCIGIGLDLICDLLFPPYRVPSLDVITVHQMEAWIIPLQFRFLFHRIPLRRQRLSSLSLLMQSEGSACKRCSTRGTASSTSVHQLRKIEGTLREARLMRVSWYQLPVARRFAA